MWENLSYVLNVMLIFHMLSWRGPLSLGKPVRAARILRPGRAEAEQGRRHDILRERRLLHHRMHHAHQGDLEAQPQGTSATYL